MVENLLFDRRRTAGWRNSREEAWVAERVWKKPVVRTKLGNVVIRDGYIYGIDDIDFWIGGLAEKTLATGGLLGSSFNFVFETQLEALQSGDPGAQAVHDKHALVLAVQRDDALW